MRAGAMLLVSALFCLLMPASAFAALEVDSLKATAQVETDGALRIVEQRTFLFDEERSIILLPLSAMQADSRVTVSSIRYAHATAQGGIDGDWTTLSECAFSPDMREAYESTAGISAKVSALEAKAGNGSETASFSGLPRSDSFAVDERERGLYLFFAPTSGRVVFDYDFTITNDIRAFDDVAELYWDYVPSDDTTRVTSVNVAVRLPLPEGMEAVVGQNVHAWGHGASGSVDVKADGTVVYRAPEVRPGQYAQAHVLFPVSWVTNLPLKVRHAHSGTRLDDARAEEEAWTDTWSAWLTNSLSVDLVFVGVGIAAIVAAGVLYLLFGREPKPHQDSSAAPDESFEAYEAPVVGRLLRGGHGSTVDLVACLMQLASRGALQIDVVEGEGAPLGPLGRGYEDVRIKAGTKAKDLIRSRLDQELFRLLFDRWGEGYMSVTLADIQRAAQADVPRYRQELHDWSEVLAQSVREVGFFDRQSARVQKGVMIAGCILCAGTLFFGVWGGSFIRGTALLAAGLTCLVIGNYLRRRTSRGVQVEASARAWLDKVEGEGQSLTEAMAPYLLELGYQGPVPYVPQSSPRAFASFWLDPRIGRGGKPSPSFAVQLARKLDEWG